MSARPTVQPTSQTQTWGRHVLKPGRAGSCNKRQKVLLHPAMASVLPATATMPTNTLAAMSPDMLISFGKLIRLQGNTGTPHAVDCYDANIFCIAGHLLNHPPCSSNCLRLQCHLSLLLHLSPILGTSSQAFYGCKGFLRASVVSFLSRGFISMCCEVLFGVQVPWSLNLCVMLLAGAPSTQPTCMHKRNGRMRVSVVPSRCVSKLCRTGVF